MNKMLRIVAVGALATSVGLASTIWRGQSTKRQGWLRTGSLHGANVLLVSIDTLRADRVGAYGSRPSVTPTIDTLAAEGFRFATTYAHVPLTLPSHASLMTASLPIRTGVHDNGTQVLSNDAQTLATTLKAAGYRTAAFVGAFVLDARFGLNRGFDVYDDQILGNGMRPRSPQRSAEEVLAPASRWILSNESSHARGDSTPWFVWTHLYDAHAPYTPPEPYRSNYASDPYAGGVAYADAMLGRFLAELRAIGALDNTVLVVTSDHGESLGEHGERAHGLFAYNSTLRVPLIIWAPSRLRPGIFGDVMRLIDVAPTVLDLLGLSFSSSVDGRSVRPFIARERPVDSVASYFEALNANLTRHWAPLTGVVRGQWKLIDLPIPELYDLESDPSEQRNLYATEQGRARALETRLDAIRGGLKLRSAASIDVDAERRLRSLGYVVGPSTNEPEPKTYTAHDDPKALVHLTMAVHDAADLWSRGDRDGAIASLRRVVAERPDFPMASNRLSFMLRVTGQINDQIDLVGRNGTRVERRNLAIQLRNSNDLKASALVLEQLAGSDSSDVQSLDALGQTYARMGRAREAEAIFRKVLRASPKSAETLTSLGVLYLSINRTSDAIVVLSRAIAADPGAVTAHQELAFAYARQGNRRRAAQELRNASRF